MRQNVLSVSIHKNSCPYVPSRRKRKGRILGAGGVKLAEFPNLYLDLSSIFSVKKINFQALKCETTLLRMN